MAIAKFVSVVTRRGFGLDESQAVIFPIIEPLFRIETHMSFEERMELFRLALLLQPGFVACEIGSYLGASTAFLGAAATIRGGHVHAVDTWRNDAMPDEPGHDTFQRFLTNTRLFQHLITNHRGFAADMKDGVPEVDFLFVDGDHSYEGARADLMHYGPKIKPGGTLLLHDFQLESIRRAVEETFASESLEDIGTVHSLKAYRVRRPKHAPIPGAATHGAMRSAANGSAPAQGV
jgi:predicted O-methyltransferase YrrM